MEKKRYEFAIDEIIDLKFSEQVNHGVTDNDNDDIQNEKIYKENYELLSAIIEKKLAEAKIEFLMIMRGAK